MQYKYILSFDPSGNFNEGKGTTGWCLLDREKDAIISIGAISAKDYKKQEAYWGQHLTLIHNIVAEYKSVMVSIEDYMLYANAAHSQVNSKLETPQVIGVLKYYCYANNIAYKMRLAGAVKSRWADHILVHLGYLQQYKRGYTTHCVTRKLCDHEIDAIRHAVHCHKFEAY